MRWAMAALLFVLAGCASAPSPEDPCYHDRDALLALDYDAFDNDPDGGWRPLANEAGCEDAAADLIEAFRVERATTPRQTMGLVHHEAQLRAAAGETRRAVSLLRTLLPLTDDTPEMQAYHRAEIAFLQGDRAGLEAARDDLATLPPPPGWEAGVAAFRETYPDYPAPVWPVNLDVVDGFLNCFGKPYGEAYSETCR